MTGSPITLLLTSSPPLFLRPFFTPITLSISPSSSFHFFFPYFSLSPLRPTSFCTSQMVYLHCHKFATGIGSNETKDG